VIEDRFGSSPPWSVGVEEELMILDAETLALAPAVYELIERAGPVQGELKTELHASIVELTSPVCLDAAEAGEALASLREAAAAAAGQLGLRVAAAGSHPFSPPKEQEVARENRYADFVQYAGMSAKRQGVSGLHVHIGMPDAETCFNVLEALLPWLPVVLALSANSPYYDGLETGLLSTRAEVLAALPRSGAPPAFGSYDGWVAFVERLQAAGLPLMTDYRSFWWDVRPHPMYGTLEIRMPDQPTSLARTVAFVDLLQRLCRSLASGPAARVDPARRGDYAQNRWAAARFGAAAGLIHPDGDRVVPAKELANELQERVGPVPGLEVDSCEAERQLEVGRASGLKAVTADLADQTSRLKQWP
jgi:glutamate---cysteine ligase / carboxylate-amine ligase